MMKKISSKKLQLTQWQRKYHAKGYNWLNNKENIKQKVTIECMIKKILCKRLWLTQWQRKYKPFKVKMNETYKMVSCEEYH